MIAAMALLMVTAGSQAVEREGMRVAWTFEDDALVCTVEAPTTGWVTVGVNHPRAGLEGARLFMARVDRRGRAEVEEHHAHPPAHTRVGAVEVLEGRERDGRTMVRFRVPRGGLLEPGRAVHLILAFSAEDDFGHHSRMRTAVERTL